MTHPLAICDVWKSFEAVTAVRGLSLSVPTGSVYGFLGPNGAGKSTTIRMILGLQRPTRGTISVFGQPVGSNRLAMLRRVGSMVDAPSLYLHLTGRENLAIHSLLLDLPRLGIDAALESVDLLPAANQVVRGYSSGMKQRLALAVALLGNPDLLLLDEPTNALDPAGIQAVRNLIRELPGKRGTTVFVSSHLLAEVEQIATHVAILANGELRFEGSTAELRARNTPSLAIDVDNAERAAMLLASADLDFSIDGSRVRVASTVSMDAAQINRLLVQGGCDVSHLALEHRSLEQMFFDLTENTARAVQTESEVA